MLHAKKQYKWFILLSGIILTLLLAACGGSSASTTSAGSAGVPAAMPANNGVQMGQHLAASGQNAGKSSGSSSTAAYEPQYLIKSLQVDMQVKDTQQVATDLQTWIRTSDPRSSSAGLDYEQDPNDNNLYDVSLVFSVESTDYAQIESYLGSYAAQHNGRLLDLRESVQDVSNDYIDTTSQLKNLRAEQQRLLTFLSQAQNLNDTLTIEQKLTDVEGQIEQIEGHLNDLSGQVTFYKITINLRPIDVAAPVSQPTPQGWNPGGVFHSALSQVIAIGQALISILIWLAVYSVYIVPAAFIAWLALRWRRARQQRIFAAPLTVSSVSPPETD